MLFKQVQEIVDGTKTQTRRIVKPGEYMLASTLPDVLYDDEDPSEYVWQIVKTAKGRIKWADGRDYAVQQGRGKPGVWWNGLAKTWRCDKPDVADHSLFWQPLRIVITAIRREPLRAITEADAIAEGCMAIECDWCRNPLKGEGPAFGCFNCNGLGMAKFAVEVYRDLWESINGAGSREQNADVWVIEFEVKK